MDDWHRSKPGGRNMSGVFAVWIDGDERMIEPHWLPNDERTEVWTGSEAEARELARRLGGAVVEQPELHRESTDPRDAVVRAATECVSLRRLSGTCLLCGGVDDRLKPHPCPDACPGRALRDAVAALPTKAR
jgi:hypothetical protein